MKNKYNSNNDSLFSVDYKIPYVRDSIEYHLEESQEEMNFIKLKLTQAYQKLEFQIQSNNDLEESNDTLKTRLKDSEEKYNYEKKENTKLKQTLEVILKNRKLLQEEREQLEQIFNKKLSEKQKLAQQLRKQVKTLSSKCNAITAEYEQKQRILKDYSDRLREQSVVKDMDNHRELALLNKIQILQQQITRITQQKFIEVNRLRHQLQLYQRSPSPFFREIKIEDDKNLQRKRQFSRPCQTKSHKFNTKASQQTESDFNKQNANSLQVQPANNSLTESSISKWKRPQSVKEPSQNQILTVQTIPNTATDDQQLSLYQMARKKAQQELVALQKIKRPCPQQREKIYRLQRQIYHLDSDIAGFKRKIKRKY